MHVFLDKKTCIFTSLKLSKARESYIGLFGRYLRYGCTKSLSVYTIRLTTPQFHLLRKSIVRIIVE
jgi:hypothetical protein